ncbi:MAG TPA: citramalate synthase [Anaerolineae bacterium]|nr:citramalate synthase [Anaerolineae bacterium]
MMEVKIYDTTLRDGSQREGISFSVTDKLKIVKELDKLGIHYIEGGFAGSNPKDVEFFERVKKIKLKNSKIVAFGSTRRKNIRAEDDPNLRALIDSGVRAACVVGKCWHVHVENALRTTREENINMVGESIAFLKENGLEVFFDAEHFFDGYKGDSGYAIDVLRAAQDAGADCLVLCDTIGGALPHEVKEIIESVKSKIDAPLGIHAHNDSECAVANSLIAVQAGASQVQGTINGYGERCGNANLCSVIPALQLKLGIEVIQPEQLKLLTEASHLVSEIANLSPYPQQAYVGQSAFAHKAGLHTSAIERADSSYAHINPGLVGNIQRVVMSELAGKSTVILKAQELGIDLSDDPRRVTDILNRVKGLEHVGYHFEAADASFEILLRKALGIHPTFFKLERFRVIMEKREDGRVATEATIKLQVGGRVVIETAEGNGPVNALDKALRKAIGSVYPALDDIELTDFKVRVLDEKKGTGAATRVLVESGDGKKTWGTIGVSENIIEASWRALIDSVEYGLMHKRVHEENGLNGLNGEPVADNQVTELPNYQF